VWNGKIRGLGEDSNVAHYVYRCTVCELEFEEIQSMNDKPLKKVRMSGPCGQQCKSPVVRVLSAPNVNIHTGQPNITQNEASTVVDHWDGRRDVTVRPDIVNTTSEVQ